MSDDDMPPLTKVSSRLYGNTSVLKAAIARNTEDIRLVYGGRDDVDAIRSLAKTLATAMCVTELSFVNVTLGVDGACALAEAFVTNTSVATLNVVANEIGDEGARALANAIAVNKSCGVKTLYLGYNHIGDDGASALATMLVKNRNVECLQLSDNIIGDRGAYDLGLVLASDVCGIITFSVMHNRFSPVGTSALLASLAKNTSVRAMDISSNPVNDASICALTTSLATNTSLAYLRMSDARHYVTDNNTKRTLANALVRNTTLMQFSANSLMNTATLGYLFQRNRGMTLSRTLILLARTDSPLRRLPEWIYARIVRRVAQRYARVGANIGANTYLPPDARFALQHILEQHLVATSSHWRQ